MDVLYDTTKVQKIPETTKILCKVNAINNVKIILYNPSPVSVNKYLVFPNPPILFSNTIPVFCSNIAILHIACVFVEGSEKREE